MGIVEQIEKDLTSAMKAREELRLSVLRMAKTALKNKQIEVGKALDDAQATAVLKTLVKQRHDSVEQFRKGLAVTADCIAPIILTSRDAKKRHQVQISQSKFFEIRDFSEQTPQVPCIKIYINHAPQQAIRLKPA